MNEGICPQCNSQNRASATRCQHCGAQLDATLTIPNASERERLRYAALSAGETTQAIPAEAEIHAYTGANPSHETHSLSGHLDMLSEIQMGSVHIGGDLQLTELKSGARFFIPHHQLNDVLIGRSDSSIDFIPQIDLTAVDGQRLGVSRKHASITWRDDLLVIIDHGSKNGTYLNGVRLVPGQLRILRNDDIVTCGEVQLRVAYLP